MLRIILDENNDFPVAEVTDGGFVPGGPKLAAGMDSAATAIRSVLSTQQGEWPFDTTFGMPWRGDILRKFFDAGATRAFVASVINTVPEIEPVTATQIAIATTSQADERQVIITVDGVTVDDEQADLDFSTTL